MKKIPLDMRQKCLARSSGVVNSPLNGMCDMKRASCVLCVDTSVSIWDILIWLADMSFNTLRIQDSVCNHC